MDKEKFIACLNLIRRLPASRIRQNVSALANLRPELQDELLQRVEQPLEVLIDEKNGKEYLKSEYNRDGDSYRSPHSNEYFPPIDKPLLPSPHLRDLEEKAMALFQEYCFLYYNQSILSIYFWDKEDGFACCVLIRKEVEKGKGLKKGNWDSINVVDVTVNKAKQKVDFRVTSTVMLNFVLDDPKVGELTLAGSYTKQKEDSEQYKDLNDEFYLTNIGRRVEEIETQIRNTLEVVYFGKTKEIALKTRYESDGKVSTKHAKYGVLPGMQKGT